jgi:hypothetical protein
MGTMKILLLFLLAFGVLNAEDVPDFKTTGILLVQDGFIALKIENSSPRDWVPTAADRDQDFISLSINGIKRAEYQVKSVDPTIFLGNSLIIFKTNFRVITPLRIRVVLNEGKTLPESDFSNNILEIELQPAP